MCCEKKALGHCEVLTLGSLCLVQRIDAGLCDYTAPMQDKGDLFTSLCLVWVAIAMPGLRACMSGLYEWPGLLGSLQFLQGLEEFVSQCFIVLPEDASAGLHSDAPTLCSHRHCFLGPPISF